MGICLSLARTNCAKKCQELPAKLRPYNKKSAVNLKNSNDGKNGNRDDLLKRGLGKPGKSQISNWAVSPLAW